MDDGNMQEHEEEVMSVNEKTFSTKTRRQKPSTAPSSSSLRECPDESQWRTGNGGQSIKVHHSQSECPWTVFS